MTLDPSERMALADSLVLPWVEDSKPLAGATVIDFGCGEGPVAEPIARRGATRVVGLDIDSDDVARGRTRLAERGITTAELYSGDFENLLERAERETGPGSVDAFVLAATLEHMLIDERLAVLALARRLLAHDGVLVVWETPNRLLWADHHSAQTPFFHLLPDSLALAWLDRIPRRDMADAIRARETEGWEATVEELWRWGRGVSFHELELGFGSLAGRVLAGGYQPATFPVRPVLREELQLARYLEREAADVHPAFSRYWLDLVVRRDPLPPPPAVWRPWPFDDLDSAGVRVSRWGLLHLVEAGAWVRLSLEAPANAIVVGVETDHEPLVLHAETDDGPAVRLEAEGSGDHRTAYVRADLAPSSSIVLRAAQPVVLSYVGTRSN